MLRFAISLGVNKKAHSQSGMKDGKLLVGQYVRAGKVSCHAPRAGW